MILLRLKPLASRSKVHNAASRIITVTWHQWFELEAIEFVFLHQSGNHESWDGWLDRLTR